MKPATAAVVAAMTLSLGRTVWDDAPRDLGDVACRHFLVNTFSVTGDRLRAIACNRIMA